MRIAYFDCIAGASGDMILGALVDSGLALETLKDKLSALKIDDFKIRGNRVVKNGFSATKVDVIVADDVPARHLSDIKQIIEKSDLPQNIKDQSIQIFQRLCEVEAGIHGSSPDKVHLHELGGVDTIVDVVGTLSGLRELGIEKVYSSPLPMGRGFIKGAHGRIPLPAPATLALLKNVPIVGSEIEAELVTPTGAVLLTTLADQFGPIPAMTQQSVGYGAGEKDLPIPNILRILIGEQPGKEDITNEELLMFETNIDDQNPEIYDYVMSKLFAAGALDVYLVPIQMKKNRPAAKIHILCLPAIADKVEKIIFAETTTLGIRKYKVTRRCLPRSIHTVDTKFGPVNIKVAKLENGETKNIPEYEDCRRLAESNKVPLQKIYFAAQQAAAGQVE